MGKICLQNGNNGGEFLPECGNTFPTSDEIQPDEQGTYDGTKSPTTCDRAEGIASLGDIFRSYLLVMVGILAICHGGKCE